MIADHLRHARRYAGLLPRLDRAIDFLATTDLTALPEGRHELDGANLYVLVQAYTSKTPDQGRWEYHRHYGDVQLVVAGRERMGCAPLDRFTGGTYDAQKDITFPDGHGDFVELSAGGFVVLWPGEVHMPGMAVDVPEPVQKVVVKFRVD
jgi:biofilm protein TabA